MSYVDSPRLVFSGRFQTDPSTINNDPHHFDTRMFRSNYQLSGRANGSWNPWGSAAWRFFDCTVEAVVYEDGSVCDDPAYDPLVGVPVNDSDQRVEGKLVDLDSEQQGVSEIWGFQVVVGDPGGGVGFRGDFDVAPFADIWTRYPEGGGDSSFGAYYQSTLSSVLWGHEPAASRFFDELTGSLKPSAGKSGKRSSRKRPSDLSMKFNVDGFDDDPESESFTFGRVVGSIGLYEGGPRRVTRGRRLSPVAELPQKIEALGPAFAKLVGRDLTVDLGNSLPTTSVGGPLQDLGQLYIALAPDSGEPEALGEIDYRCDGWYEKTAGIVTVRLTQGQAKQAGSTPLVLLTSGAPGGGPGPLLAENPDGRWIRADQFVFRLESNGAAKARLWAMEFGEPLAGSPVALTHDDTQFGPTPPPVGTPETGLEFSAGKETDKDGSIDVTLEGNLKGSPRDYIDGQVYGVSYALGKEPAEPSGDDLLSVLVWSPYTVPDCPTWLDDVEPIFRQYADLYPVMRPIVDLSNYASVVQKLDIMQRVFEVPDTDPNYMPVTRDLSPPKREMLLKWLKDPRYMNLDSVESLHRALQQAVELEHATLPPYLTALFSIKPGHNVEIAELIRSVTLEEMLHMSLAANLLISVGGHPSINDPGFVPIYPGSLPGGLRGGLTVRLRRCSIEQIRDVFMSIEEPAETIEPVEDVAGSAGPIEHHAFTIGWFYDEIERSLERLDGEGKISFGNAKDQVESRIGPHKVFKIRSLRDAKRAIEEIKEQGEGASPLDPQEAAGGDPELAHYYKFSEIVHGRRIVPTPGGFEYEGERIPFDDDGVYPMGDDPMTSTLKPGTRAYALSTQFDRSYQALLNALHRTFNGHPKEIAASIGVMFSLQVQARTLMQTDSGRGDGTTAGPSFQLPFPE